MPHNQKWNPFLIYSDYLLAENTLTSTRSKRRSTKPRVERSGTLGYFMQVMVALKGQKHI